MIDWLTGYWFIEDRDGKRMEPSTFPTLDGDVFLRVERKTGQPLRISHVPKQFSVLRVTISGDQIKVSGNPTEYIQGFNAFSKVRPWEAVDRMLGRLQAQLGLQEYQLALDRITRIDLTQQIYCDTSTRCNLTLQAMKQGWSSPRVKLSTREETAYLGQSSQLRTIKAYCKGSSDPALYEGYPDLARFLRVEVCLRTKGMSTRGLNPKDPVSWNLEEVFAKELATTTIVANPQALEIAPEGLSATMRGHWQSWRSGVPMKREMHPSSYSYVRRELQKMGVDIAKPPTSVDRIFAARMSMDELCDRSRWHATSFTTDQVRMGIACREARRVGKGAGEEGGVGQGLPDANPGQGSTGGQSEA